jgi:hypothetical protein
VPVNPDTWSSTVSPFVSEVPMLQYAYVKAGVP